MARPMKHEVRLHSRKCRHGLIRECLGREAELVGLKKKRDDQVRQLQDLVTRFRSVARAHFGPDSKEYAQVGGTPISTRKPRTRKAEAVSQTDTGA